jgi:hypothetical protein
MDWVSTLLPEEPELSQEKPTLLKTMSESMVVLPLETVRVTPMVLLTLPSWPGHEPERQRMVFCWSCAEFWDEVLPWLTAWKLVQDGSDQEAKPASMEARAVFWMEAGKVDWLTR